MFKRSFAMLSCFPVAAGCAAYQLRWHPGPKSWRVLSQSFVSRDADTEDYVQSVPRQTLSLLAVHPVAGVDVSVGYYRIKEMFWMGGDEKRKYNRLDLRLAKDWKTGDARIEAALVIPKPARRGSSRALPAPCTISNISGAAAISA